MATTTQSTSDVLSGKRGQSHTTLWTDFARRIQKSKGAIIGLVILALLVLTAILAPVLAPFDPVRVNAGGFLTPPSLAHPFGTDQYGRDVFSRVLFGARPSLTVGFISVGIAAIVGVFVGLWAGYYGGILDDLLMRFIDVLLAFPGILLAMAIVSVLGPSLANLMIAVGISAIPSYARLTRGSVLSTREEEYVLAARAVGARNYRILGRHILPNVFAPIIVSATLGIGTSILWAAALSFLGMGSQPPNPEWGRMLSEGRQYLREHWWISTFPGLAIMVTVLSVNLLGDGLRDALDPQLRGAR
jgi:peptide/nickel transport system permease protein